MPDYEFREPRLYVEGPLSADAEVEVTASQTNYLLNVLRLDDGGSVLLFNGRDGEWRARIARPTRKQVLLRPERLLRKQTSPSDLHYLFAPLRSGRLDYMVQKATEMGAGVLRPVLTQHTQVPRPNIERCAANCVEASEQCGILTVPEVRGIERLELLLSTWDPNRVLVFCDEREDGLDPATVLSPLADRPLAVLIGPEGGFSSLERAMLTSLDFVVPLQLGPRILRADTAAVAALALVQAMAGDWRQR